MIYNVVDELSDDEKFLSMTNSGNVYVSLFEAMDFIDKESLSDFLDIHRSSISHIVSRLQHPSMINIRSMCQIGSVELCRLLNRHRDFYVRIVQLIASHQIEFVIGVRIDNDIVIRIGEDAFKMKSESNSNGKETLY